MISLNDKFRNFRNSKVFLLVSRLMVSGAIFVLAVGLLGACKKKENPFQSKPAAKATTESGYLNQAELNVGQASQKIEDNVADGYQLQVLAPFQFPSTAMRLQILIDPVKQRQVFFDTSMPENPAEDREFHLLQLSRRDAAICNLYRADFGETQTAVGNFRSPIDASRLIRARGLVGVAPSVVLRIGEKLTAKSYTLAATGETRRAWFHSDQVAFHLECHYATFTNWTEKGQPMEVPNLQGINKILAGYFSL